jgi:hypothetical protein
MGGRQVPCGIRFRARQLVPPDGLSNIHGKCKECAAECRYSRNESKRNKLRATCQGGADADSRFNNRNKRQTITH